MTNVTFARIPGSNLGVCITAVNGKPVTPVMVYRSGEPIRERIILQALNSGLLGRITAAILKS